MGEWGDTIWHWVQAAGVTLAGLSASAVAYIVRQYHLDREMLHHHGRQIEELKGIVTELSDEGDDLRRSLGTITNTLSTVANDVTWIKESMRRNQ